MQIKKPNLILDFNLYNDALKLCIHDDEWLQNAFNEKSNIIEFAKTFAYEEANRAANEFCYSNDVSSLLKHKKTKALTDQAVQFIFEQNSEDAKINLINKIRSRTYYNALAVKSLLEEYCENTRDIFNASILPHPESIHDTIKPIKKFGIQIDDKNFVVNLNENSLNIFNRNEQFNQIRKYFKTRMFDKQLQKAFVNLSETQYNQIKNQLNFYKEVKIPSTKASLNEGNTKIIFRKNQAFGVDDQIYTINGDSIKALGILRMS